jgi:hypothetical protein
MMLRTVSVDPAGLASGAAMAARPHEEQRNEQSQTYQCVGAQSFLPRDIGSASLS